MSELPDLLVALAALVPALASAFVLVWTTVKRSTKPDDVARSAAESTAAAIAEALADGELTPDEVDTIRRAFDPGDQGGRRHRGGTA